jgi:hypothetical protein
VIESGGLHVIASERHESRRIDNPLRAAPIRVTQAPAVLPVTGRQPDAHIRL